MSIIVVSNLKGGVGKTAVAIHTAQALSKRYCETLLIDFDPQSDASQLLLRAQRKSEVPLATESAAGVARPVAQKFDSERFMQLGKSLIRTVRSGFDLLSYRALEDALPSGALEALLQQKDLLISLIEEVALDYDYVVIDTPPVWSRVHEIVLECSSLTIIPIDPSEMSVRAAIGLLEKSSQDYSSSALLLRTLVSKPAKKIAAYAEAQLHAALGSDEAVENRTEKKLVSQPKRVRMKGLSDQVQERTKLFISNATIYRSEQVQRLTFLGKTIFEQSGLEHIQQEYNLLVREIEELVGDCDAEPELEDDSIAGALALAGRAA
jgi:cellulose biosynthesis protein BcsQ